MKRRNSPQKKEQEETTARGLTNTDTSKKSQTEFRITIIRILVGVENRLESLSTEIKEIKKNSQNEMKNALTELQSRMDAAVARMEEAEQRISDIEDKLIENNEAEKKKRAIKAKEHDLRIREIIDSLTTSESQGFQKRKREELG